MAIADSQPLIFDLDSDEPAQDLPWCTVSERDITFYKFFEEIKNSGEGFASSVLVLFEYLMHLRHLARRNLISGTSKQLLYQNRIEDADLSIVNDLATTIWLVFQEKVSSKSSWTRLLSALKETDSSTTFLSLKNVEEIAAVMRENWKEYSKGLNLEENVVKSAVSKRKVNGGSPDSKKTGKKIENGELSYGGAFVGWSDHSSSTQPHIHLVHDCRYSNSYCRCAAFCGLPIKRRNFRRRFCDELSRNEVENLAEYLFMEGRGKKGFYSPVRRRCFVCEDNIVRPSEGDPGFQGSTVETSCSGDIILFEELGHRSDESTSFAATARLKTGK